MLNKSKEGMSLDINLPSFLLGIATALIIVYLLNGIEQKERETNTGDQHGYIETSH